MAHYVCLLTFTDTGVRNLRKTKNRAKAFQEIMEKEGIEFITTYWTVGQYDLVHIFDAPDDITAATFGYTLSALGNVRTNTMRAFSFDEIGDIIANVKTPYSLVSDKISE